MASISTSSAERVFSIKRFLGLNESQDGDAAMKWGEASEIRNWRVTRDGDLKRRPGNEALFGLCLSYTIAYGEEEEVLAAPEDQAVTLRETISTIRGIVTISGTSSDVLPNDFASAENIYYEDNPRRIFKMTRVEVADGTATWYGQRAKAEPVTKRTVKALWVGKINGQQEILAACANTLYRLYDSVSGLYSCQTVGAINTTGHVHIFGFDSVAYILDGDDYWQYDGTTLKAVDGYVPLIAITVEPNGSYETAEQVNKLTAKRRCWLSPDGENNTFKLPEVYTDVTSVKRLNDNTVLEPSAYSFDINNGTISFAQVPVQGVNAYEVGYTAKDVVDGALVEKSFRSQIIGMRYSELYSGSQDNRVFLYGDGGADAIYTGLDYDGKPRADYFPDLGMVRVGDANTPITAMIRHYGNLICYKTDGAYSLQFGITTLSDSSMTPAFYVTPINRSIGNVAPGQAQLVNNSPVTLHGREAYQWRNGSIYSSNLSVDERQAQRISDKVCSTLAGFTLENCVCYDDNYHQEYYICNHSGALVFNYAADAWTYYDSLGDVMCMAAFNGEVLYGTADGNIERLNESLNYADGDPISCYWESSSADFGQEYTRKNSAQLWVAMKPELGSSVNVTIQTDRKETFTEKIVSADNVRNPGTREPYLKRLKLKAKKFLYYKLMFTSDEIATAPTVVSADIRVRFAGWAK